MRGFYSILPTLSPDFSGVCSTLFELGGILAIHDAGGCTGTYTGYDEPRWFDQRSRVFTSNLDVYKRQAVTFASSTARFPGPVPISKATPADRL